MTIKSLQHSSLTDNIFYRSMLAGNEPFGLATYWLSTLGDTGGDLGFSVAIDSSGNSYSVGYTDSAGAGLSDFLLVKRNSAGDVQWQRTLGGTSNDYGFGITTDSSDNVYVTGRTDSTGAGFSDVLLAKYNSAGTIQWQRILGTSSYDWGTGVATDSSGNVYVSGRAQGAGTDFLLVKYNSAGALQWQKTLGGSGTDQANSVAIDSSGNVYVGGVERSQSGDYNLLIAKYDSAGTIQWQRYIGGAGQDYGYSVTIDSLGDVYLFGFTPSVGAGSNDFLLVKYSSAGTLQWQRALGGTGSDNGYSVATDSSNNVYVLGSTDSAGAGGNDFLFAKYDSAGTIQWQRTIGGTGADVGKSVAVDSADDLYIFGYAASAGAGSNDFLLARLPNDGSLTGTYVLNGSNVVYATSSLTGITPTLTSATSSLTSSTSSLTAATSTLTDASASLTSYLVVI